MAAGLPVVHPASGGTVELVGDDAGVGVPHPESWERDEPPQRRGAGRRRRPRPRRPRPLLGRGARAGCRAVRARALARPSRGALRAPRAEVAADPADERGGVEPRPVQVEPDERDGHAPDGSDEHPRRPCAADSRASGGDSRRSLRRAAARDERGPVVTVSGCRPRATGRRRCGRRADRADHVVGLLARAPGPRAADPSCSSNAPDAHDQRRGGGRARTRSRGSRRFAASARPASLPQRATRRPSRPPWVPKAVELGSRGSCCATSASRPGGYGSRRRGTPPRPPQRARARRCARARARARELRRTSSSVATGQHRLDALVGVLVDHDHAERPVRLRLERVQQPAQLVDPSQGRDDEVERRRAPAARALGYATSWPAIPLSRCSSRSTTAPVTSVLRSRASCVRR